MRRVLAVVTSALALTLLTGCSSGPHTQPLETAIPAALVASDLGILEADAETGIDGFTRTLSVYSVFDRDTVTTDDMVEIIRLTVENTDNSSIDVIYFGGRDGTAEGNEYIDLGALALELGYSRGVLDEEEFTIGWEQAVELAKEQGDD